MNTLSVFFFLQTGKNCWFFEFPHLFEEFPTKTGTGELVFLHNWVNLVIDLSTAKISGCICLEATIQGYFIFWHQSQILWKCSLFSLPWWFETCWSQASSLSKVWTHLPHSLRKAPYPLLYGVPWESVGYNLSTGKKPECTIIILQKWLWMTSKKNQIIHIFLNSFSEFVPLTLCRFSFRSHWCKEIHIYKLQRTERFGYRVYKWK